ncbi:MAG: Leucine-tRNA ligase [Candidatus Parcubacteria bacterium]|jgi:leucyl-tRNA synthetase
MKSPMNNHFYDHKKLDAKWQKEWQKKETYKTAQNAKKKKMYVLDMFPYPSGAGLHVGHPRGYVASDVYARMKRMQGYNVLHPMGYDAFGLAAEQYAIKNKIHPSKAVQDNIKTFEKQLSIIGLSYDWSRRVSTADPEFYKWTQWIFIKLYNSWYDQKKNKARPIETLEAIFKAKGDGVSGEKRFTAKEWKSLSKIEKAKILMEYRLAYEGYSEVNWCPGLGTVLANDEIINGKSERGGFPVEKKQMRQWFMRISAYADRLLSGLEKLDWSNQVKTIQTNWIGKSVGVNFKCVIKDLDIPVQMYNSVPQTYHAETFTVIAPEHPLVVELVKGTEHEKSVMAFVDKIKKKKSQNKFDMDKEMDGIFTGRYIKSFADTGRDLPIWIASYVVADYGTGIVNASVHDERDFAFAKKFNIPLNVVMLPADKELAKKVKALEFAYVKDPNGIMQQPARFAGRKWGEVREDVINHLVEKGFATRKINYKMRDAIFARQRYWGEPIPLKHDKEGNVIPLKTSELPLNLPNVKSYEPIGTGESPLAGIPSWIKAGYETNTMPGWAGSSWYFLRYMDPKNKSAFASPAALKLWRDVDMYIGGTEHATGHLLYSRFWHKFLFDYGLVPTDEPFKALRNQGMILASDGRKMSKSWGNVVNPDECVATYGSDAFRLYEMFIGPFDSSLPWSTDSIIGTRRFVDRVWRLADKVDMKNAVKTDAKVISHIHKTIKKITSDIDTFSFNTAVAALMILLNELEPQEKINKKDFETFLKLIAPFASHVAEELWTKLGNKKSIHISEWPKFDAKKVLADTIIIGIQVNGKLRGEVEVEVGDSEKEIVDKALAIVQSHVEGKEIIKTIYVKDKIVSIVIKP